MSEQSRAVSDPTAVLERAFRQAIGQVLGENFEDEDPRIMPSQNPKFGDYQANCAMGLAKAVGMKPRDLAQQIIDAVDVSTVAETPEVAGPGFINIRLKSEALEAALIAMDDQRLGVAPSDDPHTVVIDLCGVNVAKQMHVGHLRSTVIGDALARVYERLGRPVHRENHLGDWGLPIAMVLFQLQQQGVNLETLDLSELDAAYRDAQLNAKADIRGLAAALEKHAGPHRIIELEEQNAGAHKALEDARTTLVKLQQNDPELVSQWKKLIDVTLAAVYEACELLGVKLTAENSRGESFYRDRLNEVIDAFVRAGAAEEDEGALVVRFEDRERPLLIRKSDGGYLYATTDLAAIHYRVSEIGADQVIYVVDARQRDHFRDVFDAARKINWHITDDGAEAQLVHLPFGAVLGEDGKPLKTRSGSNITLRSLLYEAVERGTAEVISRAADSNAPTHGLPEEQLREIGKAVGIGAIKYADLSNDLVKDYVFSFERMISFEGNTGPYMQYAHARICSILKRAGDPEKVVADASIIISEPAEKQLALKLLLYPQVVAAVAESMQPHRLCQYLFELADTFNSFYQNCPVLRAESDALRLSRLRLCDLVRRVLADGLDLLGIHAPPMM